MGFFSFLYQAKASYKSDAPSDLTTVYPPRTPTVSHPRMDRRIPIEIVMHILETAYDDTQPECNARLFANCALVCRDWSFIAQRFLFRHVVLRSQTSYIAFQSAVDRTTARGRMLGDAVTSMRVVLDHNQPYRLSQRSFARAVTLCPNLHGLNIALYGQAGPGYDIVGEPDVNRMKRTAPSFDERTLALLRTGPCINSLTFSNWSDNSLSLFQLLDIWPSLKSLAISGTAPQMLQSSLEPFPCALEELRTNFQTSPSIDFMKWLLHNSTSSLRTLELQRDPSSDMLDYLLTDHGLALQSLSLPTCGGHEGVASIQKCKVLRELRVESAWLPPALFKSLPNTIEHVALGIDMDTPLPPVLQTIKRSDVLRAVSLHLWRGGEHHPQLNPLKIACAIQGIELTMTKDIRDFRSVSRGVLDRLPPVLECTI